MVGDGEDGFVGELGAVVEFEAFEVAACSGYGGDGDVGEFFAAGDVEALEAETVVCYCHPLFCLLAGPALSRRARVDSCSHR